MGPGGPLDFYKNHISNESDGNTFQVGEEAEKDGQTLLVPTNAAFDKLPEDVNSRLLADQAFAQKVVQRHILDEVLSSSDNFLNILDVISSDRSSFTDGVLVEICNPRF